MDCDRMLEQIAETKERLFKEGYLNNNFVVLENFEKKHGSEFFVKGALASYFETSAEILTNLEQELKKDPLDILILQNLLFRVREHSVSVGANKVLIKVNQLELCMGSRNTQRWQDALQELKLVHERFKNRMELYFEMMECEPPFEIEDDPGFEDGESTDEE
ncbi:pseudo histidine-containing phosphotransfer protein 2-like [Apium graveolens]|uniref:pseudo histidine-containing phosphotransfer protein 2-like n=1 Tax=Apium graveolens TaxID=4045 RepID=UPI003D7B98E1